MKENIIRSCSCTNRASEKNKPEKFIAKKSMSNSRIYFKSFSSVFVSLLIAFFPKCPFCWAAYMSVFGSLSLSQLPYAPWLLPIFYSFLALHLIILLLKARIKGYGPFLLSLVGAIIIFSGRTFLPNNNVIMIVGMIMILSGSLWNGFSLNRFQQLRRIKLKFNFFINSN